MKNGLLLMALQTGIVLMTGAKYLMDRSNLPRAWARVQPFDPNLPIRGRYVRLSVVAPLQGTVDAYGHVKLISEHSQLRVVAVPEDTGNFVWGRNTPGEARLSSPVAFFIPEHVSDPSQRAAGEELWVEISLPRKGPPRPIRLAVKKAGSFTVLPLD